MRAHRLAITAVLVSTVLAAGCGSGRDSEAFLPDETATTAPAAPREIPQVVVAGPKQALLDERDAAAADAQDSRAAAVAADARRKAARRELREERAKSRRVSKRAGTRETKLKAALVTAREKKRAGEKSEAAAPEPQTNEPDAPITASDTTGKDLIAERNRRSDAEARAAVLRFHELLDRRDVRSCDLLTEKLLLKIYGTEDPMARCHAAVAAISSSVSGVITDSRTNGKASSVGVITRIGEQEQSHTMHLVLVDGTWLFDDVERRTES